MRRFLSTLRNCFFLLVILSCLQACTLKKIEPKHYPDLSAYPKEKRPVIAVLPFKYKSDHEQYKGIVNKIPDKLISELYGIKRYRIIERFRMDEVLKELSLGQSGIVDPSRAISIGKQLGAEMILLGSLTDIKINEARQTIGIASIDTLEISVDLDARVISVEKGEVEAIAKATGKEINERRVALGASMGERSEEETAINTAIDRAVKEIAYRLSEEIEPKK